MNKWLALLIACLALGVVAAGCGGDDDGGDGGGSAATTEPAQAEETTETGTTEAGTTGGGGGGAQAETVVMKDIKFDPKDVTVAVGGTVEWKNENSAPHDVTKTSGPGAKFSSGTGNMQKGDTYEQTFDTAGTIEYVCTVHPGMEGTITVE